MARLPKIPVVRECVSQSTACTARQNPDLPRRQARTLAVPRPSAFSVHPSSLSPTSRLSPSRSTPQPGSAICPAQKSSLRCVSHRRDVLPRDRPAPVSLLLPRLPPPPPSLFPALGRSLALEFRLRLRVRVQLDPHLNTAILRSKGPPYVQASPRVPRRGAAPLGPT